MLEPNPDYRIDIDDALAMINKMSGKFAERAEVVSDLRY